jgi:predicted component of type VI protein secretion system
MFSLQYTSATIDRTPFTSDAASVTIGRDPGCGLQWFDAGVADRHAAIERADDGYYISDLGSPTGVRVNNQAVTRQRLATGDEIEIGSVRVRFNVVHAQTGEHRRTNIMQILLVLVVIVSIASQVVVLAWIFTQPRPAKAQRPGRDRAARQQPASGLDQPASPVGVTSPGTTLPAPSTNPAPEPVRAIVVQNPPAVLTRKLHIASVERRDAADHVQLHIRVKAQVGDRELDTSAARVTVEFFVRSPDNPGQVTPAQDVPLQMNTANWENFQTRTFRAQLAVPLSRCAGYIVRTYYRDELQDVAVTAGLESVAPNSLR